MSEEEVSAFRCTWKETDKRSEHCEGYLGGECPLDCPLPDRGMLFQLAELTVSYKTSYNWLEVKNHVFDSQRSGLEEVLEKYIQVRPLAMNNFIPRNYG